MKTRNQFISHCALLIPRYLFSIFYKFLLPIPETSVKIKRYA